MDGVDEAHVQDELCEYLWEHHLDELAAHSKDELRRQLCQSAWLWRQGPQLA